MIGLKEYAESLKKIFLANDIILPDSKIEEMAKHNLSIAEEFLLLQAEEEKREKESKDIILPVLETEEEGLVIYSLGKHRDFPFGEKRYEYFKEKGFEPVNSKNSNWLFRKAVEELTYEKLEQAGIFPRVYIFLPIPKEDLRWNTDQFQREGFWGFGGCKGNDPRGAFLGLWEQRNVNTTFFLRKIKTQKG